MKKNKKSQASVEFLLTYGWAILIVLGITAALLKYNILTSVFSPLKNEVCQVYSSINCLGATWHNDGTLELALSNDAQTQLQIQKITITDKLNRFKLTWQWKPQTTCGGWIHYHCCVCNPSDSYCEEKDGTTCGYEVETYKRGWFNYCLSDCTANLTQNSILKFTLIPNRATDNINEFKGNIEIEYSFIGSNLTTEKHIAKGYIFARKH